MLLIPAMIRKNNFTNDQLKELAFSPEEKDELKLARNSPITFDADCPEVTPEKADKFYRINDKAAAPK